MDIATTRATADDEVARAYLFGPRSRTSLFTEGSVTRSSDGVLSRRSDANKASFCQFYGMDGTYDASSNGMANCFGYHQCDPDPNTMQEWDRDTFQDTCFQPYTVYTETVDEEASNPISFPEAAYHTVGPEAGTPPPGRWNEADAGYESVLLDTFPCDPDDGISQNVLFATGNDGAPLCLFNPAEKATGTAAIHIAANDEDSDMPAQAPLHKVMFYSPIHRFVKEGTTWYQYTIRATMLMHWGLLVGDIYGHRTTRPTSRLSRRMTFTSTSLTTGTTLRMSTSTPGARISYGGRAVCIQYWDGDEHALQLSGASRAWMTGKVHAPPRPSLRRVTVT